MTGWIAVDRGLFDDPDFPREPMSEREAWIWIIAQAAWKDTRHRVGSALVDVPRGSFFATLREMQSVWMWGSNHRVRDFLNRLENQKKITRKTGAKNTRTKAQITVCNYETNQHVGRKENANAGAAGAQSGRTKGTREQVNKDSIIGGGRRASPLLEDSQDEKQTDKRAENRAEKRPEDVQLWRDVMKAAGVLTDPYPKWWRAPDAVARCARWRTELGLSRADILTVAKANPRHYPEPPTGPKALDGEMHAMACHRRNMAKPLSAAIAPKQPSARKPKVGREARDAAQAENVSSSFLVHVPPAHDPPGETIDHQPQPYRNDHDRAEGRNHG